jgi:hypothetical protein
VRGTDNTTQDDQQSSTTWYESAGQDSGSVRSQSSFVSGQDGGSLTNQGSTASMMTAQDGVSIKSQGSYATARGDSLVAESLVAESLGDADEFASLRSVGSTGSFVSASGSCHSNASPALTSLKTAR